MNFVKCGKTSLFLHPSIPNLTCLKSIDDYLTTNSIYFQNYSWYAVLEGMKVRPKSYDTTIDSSVFETIEKALIDSYELLNTNAGKVLSHGDFIKRLY